MRTRYSDVLSTLVFQIMCLPATIHIDALARSVGTRSPLQLTTPAERADFCIQIREATTHQQGRAIAIRNLCTGARGAIAVWHGQSSADGGLRRRHDRGNRNGYELGRTGAASGTGDSNAKR